ncbi:MAG: cation:proton antiporter [Desulfobulbaceae bacterium]|nr:cation:proton antiporter [Desulfobulbaceae bacterium]
MQVDAALTLSLVIFAGITCQWLAWRVKLPAILFLLLTGIIAGPIMGWLDSGELFGDLLFPFISLSVAVILFEGSLTLRFHQIAGLSQVVRDLVSFGVLVTWLITTVVTRFALDFSWELSFLFGAITVVTGPTVIVPMLRTVRPTSAVANVLRWEGIMIDPIGAILAVLVYEFILSGSGGNAMGHTLVAFGKIIAVGFCLGGVCGYLYGAVLRLHWLPEYLHNVAALALVFIVFSVSNSFHHESGLLAVTVMGVWLANMKEVPVDEILDFKESLSVLLISVLFIILAARIDFADFSRLGWPAVFVLLAIQFLARPLSVIVSTFRSKLTWPERHLLAWIAPRGIVAAAIAALFAIRLEEAGFSEAPLLVPLTFLVIMGTVVLQSATAGFIARMLGVSEADPKGVLIIGANHVAQAVAKALLQAGFRPLLVDASWAKIRKARMEGLEAFYGNPVSEHADRTLDLVGMGRMFALSAHSSLNTLACMHYRMELGVTRVYALQTSSEKDLADERRASRHLVGSKLFGKDVTFSRLSALLAKDWKIRSTKLTETFTYDSYKKKYGGGSVPLFAVSPKGELAVFTVEKEVDPAPGWKIVSLVPENGEQDVPE